MANRPSPAVAAARKVRREWLAIVATLACSTLTCSAIGHSRGQRCAIIIAKRAVCVKRVTPATLFARVIFSSGKESTNGANQTQTAQRGHTTLQRIYSRPDQSPCLHGRRAAICNRRPDGGDHRRGVDAQLRSGAAGAQERRPHQGHL